MATIRYLVHNVERSAAFYVEHLGFEVVQQWGPAFAMLRRADLELWLSGPNSSAARPMPDGARPEAGGWNRFVVEVQELEAWVEAMAAAGVQFRNRVVTGPGGRQILVQDPDGNLVELFEPAQA